MEAARHSIFDNKIQLYRRPNSPFWWASCSIKGTQKRSSTAEESLAHAKDVARDWYLGLLGKYRAGELVEGKLFKVASAKFMSEYETLTEGQRSEVYVEGHRIRIKKHLDPFFGEMPLRAITDSKVQDYRIHRMKTGMSRKDQARKKKLEKDAGGKPFEFERASPPSRTTLHQEIVCLRQILKTAKREGWIDHLPDLSSPYKSSPKIAHRAWFSLEEYRTLYQATRRRKNNPPRERWRWACEQMHDFVLFMANTGLRPDEALRLQFRDVSIIEDDATKERILLIKVSGKRGVGNCKSTSNAVRPFERLRDRERISADDKETTVTGLEKPDELLFPGSQHELFNAILDEEGLKFDREGRPRTSYSLRHTYICFRLLEGADIYQIAKNCRTSVEMIQKYYASHIETDLDAAAINVLRNKKYRADEDEDEAEENRPKRRMTGGPKDTPASPKRFGKKPY